MTATHVKPKRIGPYTAGEVPPPFVYQFLEADEDGNESPVDLTGFTTVRFNVGKVGATALQRVGALSDGPTGKVSYTWVEGDIPTEGAYQAMFWATDGDTLYASRPLIFNAGPAVGTPPDI